MFGIYKNQRCWVRWSNGFKSRDFGIGNGTRQGSCLSPALFSLYMDELLLELRKSGLGCYVGGLFAGAGSYCDDLVLLAPTRSALQSMITICKNYANRHNLVFSTDPNPTKSKTKCLLFQLKGETPPVPILLNGQPLPWVPHAAHLGHEFDTSGLQELDCNIGESVELLNVFQFADPLQKVSSCLCDYF